MSETVNQTLGNCVWVARRKKGLSQRELAALLKIDFTYLSKIENNHTDYPPSPEVIESLAHHLSLDANELHGLSGRIDPELFRLARELVMTYPREMCTLFRKMRDDPGFAQKLMKEASLFCPNCGATGWDSVGGCDECSLSPEDLA
jgi:transcriptional regulator with XRE-family HTH domain